MKKILTEIKTSKLRLLLLAVFAFALSNVSAQRSCYANFTYSESGLTVNFTDSSYSAHTYKRIWSFGDGSHSDSRTPTHTFAKDGSYRVCLAITDTAAHCTDTMCQTITLASCHAFFVFETKDLTGYFKDSSETGHFHTRAWTFGDGGRADGKAPTHTYDSSGTYEVCLSVTDTVTKCTSHYCTHVEVRKNAPCNAEFHYSVHGRTVQVYAADSTYARTTTFSWKFGDGSTGSGYSTHHTYSADSTYRICLTVKDSSHNCSDDFCREVSVDSNSAIYSISGKIYADSVDAYPGMVWLIAYNAADTSLKALAKSEIHHDSTGAFYSFSDLKPGTYYTKAALGERATNYKHYMPTYHTDALKWKNADQIIITNAEVTDADIYLKKGSNSGGKGFVSGKISQGANKQEGDPLADISVLILDENGKPVAYSISDVNGDFSIDNLAYGKYQVYADVPGLTTFPLWIELTEAHAAADNIEIKVNSTSVYTSIFEAFKGQSAIVKLYPNPAGARLMLSINAPKAEKARITVNDISGRQMFSESLDVKSGSQELELNTDKLSKGIYFLKVQMNDGSILQGRFVKE